MNISFRSNEFQTLINKPQTFISETKPEAKQSNAPVDSGNKVSGHKKLPVGHALKMTAIVGGATSLALSGIAGRGNISKGFNTIFKGNKHLDDVINNLKDSLKNVSDNVTESLVNPLKRELAEAPQKFADSVVSNPKNNESFVMRLLDKINTSKYGDLTDNIENKIIDTGKKFSEFERRIDPKVFEQ